MTTGPVPGNLDNAIFWQIRMPRAILACLVGAELAVAGVILQDLFLNPLTDPYVTGVSSGAAVGATIGIVLHLAELPWMTVLALVGGFATLTGVWVAARRRGRVDVFVLLLAGVTISYLASAGRRRADDPRGAGHARHRLLAHGQLLRARAGRRS